MWRAVILSSLFSSLFPLQKCRLLVSFCLFSKKTCGHLGVPNCLFKKTKGTLQSPFLTCCDILSCCQRTALYLPSESFLWQELAVNAVVKPFWWILKFKHRAEQTEIQVSFTLSCQMLSRLNMVETSSCVLDKTKAFLCLSRIKRTHKNHPWNQWWTVPGMGIGCPIWHYLVWEHHEFNRVRGRREDTTKSWTVCFAFSKMCKWLNIFPRFIFWDFHQTAMASLRIFVLSIFFVTLGFRLEHSGPVFKKISYREYEVDFKKEKPVNTFAGKQELNVLGILICFLFQSQWQLKQSCIFPFIFAHEPHEQGMRSLQCRNEASKDRWAFRGCGCLQISCTIQSCSLRFQHLMRFTTCI